MAIEINSGFLNNSPVSLDSKYSKFVSGSSVPYASIQEANMSIPTAYRSMGLTTLIYKNGIPTEYWYRFGIMDTDLTEKTTPPVTDYNSLSGRPDLSLYALKSTTINNYPLSDSIVLTKGDFGLSLVDNTRDINKPVSIEQAAAISLKQSLSQKNQSNGYAGIGSNGLVPSSILPSYIDQIVEYPNYTSFPAIGVGGTIYKANDTGVQYRWSGTSYSLITSGAVQSVNGLTGNVTLSFQSPITLTTTGSGAATFSNNTLNIPVSSGTIDESNLVHRSLTETVTGLKTFTSKLTVNQEIQGSRLSIRNSSMMLGFLNADNLTSNTSYQLPTSAGTIALTTNADGSSNDIPLSGTKPGSLVTGNIEFPNSVFLYSGVTTYQEAIGDSFSSTGFRQFLENGREVFIGIQSDENVPEMTSYDPYNSTVRRTTPGALDVIVPGHQSSLFVGIDGFYFVSNQPNFYGLRAQGYLGNYYDDYTYVQRIYVDKRTLQNAFDASVAAGAKPTINTAGNLFKIQGDASKAITFQNGSEANSNTALFSLAENGRIEIYSDPNNYAIQSIVYSLPTAIPNSGDVLTATSIDQDGKAILEWQPGGKATTTGDTPTISDSTPADTISNIAITGTNAAFSVSFTVNAGEQVNGSLFTITYNNAGWTAVPKVISSINLSGGFTYENQKIEADAVSTTNIDVAGQNLSAGNYKFTVFSMQ